MRELNQETRVRLTYATISGAFGMLSLTALPLASWISAAVYFAIACGLMWLATSTRWGNHVYR